MGHETPRQPPRLLVVYNADGGLFSAVSDAVHKVVSPATYPCSLCAVTYGAVSMRREWRRYLDALPVTPVFHHRDDFARAYPSLDLALPAILTSEGTEAPEVLVGAGELDRIGTVAELVALVDRKLAERGLAQGPGA